MCAVFRNSGREVVERSGKEETALRRRGLQKEKKGKLRTVGKEPGQPQGLRPLFS